MIRHNEWSVQLTEAMNLPSQTAQWGVRRQEILRRDTPDSEHNPGSQKLDLAH
jgi:hypothetical protein